MEDACFLYPTRKVKHEDGQRFAIAAASIGFLAVSDRITCAGGDAQRVNRQRVQKCTLLNAKSDFAHRAQHEEEGWGRKVESELGGL